MDLTVDIQVAIESDETPDPDQIRNWVGYLLARPEIRELTKDRKITDESPPIELSCCIVDEDESQKLNSQYRHIDKPTNVLSFPSGMPSDLPIWHLGDIIVCAPIVEKEAKEQDKSVTAHWAHMVVHGVLHLLGFDHIEDQDADIMEELEIKILTGLQFANPYQTQIDQQNHIHANTHSSNTAN